MVVIKFITHIIFHVVINRKGVMAESSINKTAMGKLLKRNY